MSISTREAVRALTDHFSGEIVGRGYGPRAQTAGYGTTYRA